MPSAEKKEFLQRAAKDVYAEALETAWDARLLLEELNGGDPSTDQRRRINALAARAFAHRKVTDMLWKAHYERRSLFHRIRDYFFKGSWLDR